MGEQRRDGEKDPEDRVRDHERRNEGGQRLGDEELLATNQGGQDRLQRALLALDAVRALEHLLSGFQTAGQLRPDFDPYVIAIAIRAAIDAVPSGLALDPGFDIDRHPREIITIFDRATRATDTP